MAAVLRSAKAANHKKERSSVREQRLATQVTFILYIFTVLFCGFYSHSLLAQDGANDLRQVLVRAAIAFTKVPYRYGGTTPRGLDCSAFTQKVYRIAGLELPRTTKAQAGDPQGSWVNSPLPGDLVFFKNTRGRGVSHVGIYVGDGYMVHASVESGEVVEASLSQRYFRKHFAGYRRFLQSGSLEDFARDSSQDQRTQVALNHDAITVESIILNELINQ